MTSYATRPQTAEQNDLKKLKSKYASKLSTLKELFADWTDDDLLLALEEADGVLEVAVDRISEGHATQWGEVKTKKSKKEAQQKAKAAAAAAAATTSSSSMAPSSYQKSERTPAPRNNKPPRAARPSSTKKPSTPSSKPVSNQASWGYQSSSASFGAGSKMTASADIGGSWAAIASTKPANEPAAADWAATTTSSSTAAADSWGEPSWNTPATAEQPLEEPSTTSSSSALLDDADKPKSWASLLKSAAKPEVEKPIETNTIELPTEEPVVAAAVDEWAAPIEQPTNAWGAASFEAPVEEEKKAAGRRLKQEDPVVITNNSADVGAVDVKFGSLNLDDDVKEEPVAPVAEAVVPEPTPAEPVVPVAQESAKETVIDTKVETSTAPKEEPAYLKQEQQPAPAAYQQQQQQPAPAAQPQQQVPPQQQQPQQQQPQQPFGMDHLTSAYSSYQHPSGMSGFGMNPMGNVPDYGIYGGDAQRAAAAAAMGYYDPSAFGNHSPAASNASAYPSRDKFGQDIAPGQSGQNQGMHGQVYPGMPYYPYYYMGHYNAAYGQSMYGQPMMNKTMYPNMYQQQPPQPPQQQQQPPQQQQQQQQPQQQAQQAASVNKNAQSYNNGASASPYALHSQLYNQQSGYDDLQQFSSLHDYQKSPYTAGQQLHSGFLGSQPSLQQQAPAQQAQDKNDARSSAAQPQQPVNSYLSQQQMFSYQQYPQQQYWNQ